MVMHCPHCHKEIPGKECPGCGAVIPTESRYCMECGVHIEEPVKRSEGGDEFDIDNRVLCSDGTCTGIIVDGKCTECGKPAE